MSKSTLKIHSENILPIIKKWLYTDRDIFLRELVSNSCDAISKCKVLGISDDFRIDITISKEGKSLLISDNGIGMSAQEVKKYIAQIAFSGAEDFLEKYENAESSDAIIGHFGLGFYSSFMVADKVEIDTLSHKEKSKAAHWSCDGGIDYELTEGTRDTRGTAITLHLNEENHEFLEEDKLRAILSKYCSFLPYPLYLEGKQINEKEPLYTKPAAECTDEEYLDFYRQLHPMEPDPIFWVHLNVDYPFNLKGILYFPKVDRRFDPAKPQIQLYCNRVFVSDNLRDLLPDYLTILRGAIDSPDIPLNVSRSSLQMDRTVRQLGSHIAKKLADKLKDLMENERERYETIWPDLETILKIGSLQDEKFYERLADLLLWKDLEGNFAPLNKDQEKVYYTTDPHAKSLELYKEKKIPVLISESPLNTPFIQLLERKHSPLKFHRVDGTIDEAILDKEREKTVLDEEGKTEASHIADFFRTHLGSDQLEVEAKSLASDELPAMLLIDENMRRIRDAMALSQEKMAGFPEKQRFILNTNSPLIARIFAKSKESPELGKELALHLLEMTRLSQKELQPGDLPKLIERNTKLLEKLI
ncbi:MAG: molecular chaperone HtpG [Candidatus Algichlamydia australiensis]|nr:molecular chaperone HtpG [Chlamydiales bacterium]